MDVANDQKHSPVSLSIKGTLASITENTGGGTVSDMARSRDTSDVTKTLAVLVYPSLYSFSSVSFTSEI